MVKLPQTVIFLCSFGFFLLWSDGAKCLWEGHNSACWDLVFVDEEDGIGSFDSAANALR